MLLLTLISFSSKEFLPMELLLGQVFFFFKYSYFPSPCSTYLLKTISVKISIDFYLPSSFNPIINFDSDAKLTSFERINDLVEKSHNALAAEALRNLSNAGNTPLALWTNLCLEQDTI